MLEPPDNHIRHGFLLQPLGEEAVTIAIIRSDKVSFLGKEAGIPELRMVQSLVEHIDRSDLK